MPKKRRGRTRKNGERFPSGRLKPAGEAMSGALFQRIIKSRKLIYEDQLIASELGRLKWYGHLTANQAAAGFKIAEIYGRYERFHGKLRSARSPSYQRAFGNADIADELLAPEALREREQQMRRADAAFRQLQRIIPERMRAAVEEVCVDDRPILPVHYAALAAVLDAVGALLHVDGATMPARDISRINTATDGQPRQAPSEAQRRHGADDRASWFAVMAKLRPDLSEPDLLAAYEIAQSLKARERFRREKAK